MAKLLLPKKDGFYKAKVQGAWEPVSVFSISKKKIGVILIGQDRILSKAEINKEIEEFGGMIVMPE